MPRGGSDEGGRPDEIRESSFGRGLGERRPRTLAKRPTSRRRRREGRTPTAREGGAAETPLEDCSKRELYKRARELGIEGRSALSKADLVFAIRSRS